MKSHPILFSGPMVLALLAGRKTQTRRLSPRWDKCEAGDRLKVKETWTSGYRNGCWGTIFRADNAFAQGKRQHEKGPHFDATNPPGWLKWRPSLFLPPWASRIELELTEPVRVESVQEIKEADAIAEGIVVPPFDPCDDSRDCWHDGTARTLYEHLWGEINGWSGPGSWSSNPTVRVLTFKVVVP